MKMSLFERAITCCLLGAGTFAVASGMKLTAHSTDGTGSIFVSSEGDDDDGNDRESGSTDDEQDADEGKDNDINEDRIAKLVAEAENASDEAKEEKRNELRDALTEVFRKKTQAQRTRIEGMKEKLEAIETQLERRSNLEEQIVQRRLAELLGDKDELSWDHEPAFDVDVLGRLGGAKHSWGSAFGFDLDRVMEMEYSNIIAKKGNHQIDSRAREQLLQAKKQAELAGKATAAAARQFLDAQNSDSRLLEKRAAERVRNAGEVESQLRFLRNTLDRKLPELGELKKEYVEKKKLFEQHLLENSKGDDINNWKMQLKVLDEKLEEFAKQKAEAAKSRGK